MAQSRYSGLAVYSDVDFGAPGDSQLGLASPSCPAIPQEDGEYLSYGVQLCVKKLLVHSKVCPPCFLFGLLHNYTLLYSSSVKE